MEKSNYCPTCGSPPGPSEKQQEKEQNRIRAAFAELRKVIYEPEHEETTCWCKPRFIKREEGNLEIVHNEQRDVLTEFVRKNFYV